MTDTNLNDSPNQRSIKNEKLEKSAVSLLNLDVGEKGVVVRIVGGMTACRRLNELGLVPGTKIEMVNKINSGPVMIRVKGSKLALGRGMATKVYIKK